MIKKHNQKTLILTCLLLTAMFVLVTYMTKQDTSAPAGSTSADVSAETPAQPETDPIDPAPAIIGGAAAIAVYYGGSLIIGALKKNKSGKNDQPPASNGKKKK